MALSYVGGTTGTSGNLAVTSYSVSLTGLTGGSGSAPQQGDIVIVVTGWSSTTDDNPGVTTSGYTEIADLRGDDTRDANVSVCWKIMGSTPDTSVTVSSNNSTSQGAATAVHVWRGVDPTTPFDVTTTTAAPANPNSGHINSPSITPVTAGCVILSCGGATSASGGVAFTQPTNFINKVHANGATSTVRFHAVIASYASWTSGAYDPVAWVSGTSSTADSWAAATLVLRPEPLAAISTLTDDFSAQDTAKWLEDINAAHSIAYTSGKMRITLDGTIDLYSGVNSQDQYDFTGDGAYIRLSAVPTAAADGTQAYFAVTKDLYSFNDAAMIFVSSDGNIYFDRRVGGARTMLASAAYSSSTHAWLRIRESSGTIYYDTAPATAANPPGSGDWVNRASALSSTYTGWSFSAAYVLMGGGSWDTTTLITSNIDIDSFNTGATVTSSTGTLAQTLGNATVAGTGTVSLSGSLSQTLADATVTGTGTVLVAGSSSTTLADATASATATALVAGSLAQTLDSATAAGTGTVDTTASLSAALDAATAAGTGTVTVTGSASLTLDDAAGSSAGAVLVAGTAALTTADATLSATGTVADVVPFAASAEALSAVTADLTPGLRLLQADAVCEGASTADLTAAIVLEVTAFVGCDLTADLSTPSSNDNYYSPTVMTRHRGGR